MTRPGAPGPPCPVALAWRAGCAPVGSSQAAACSRWRGSWRSPARPRGSATTPSPPARVSASPVENGAAPAGPADSGWIGRRTCSALMGDRSPIRPWPPVAWTRDRSAPPEPQPAADRSRPFDPAAGIMNLDHLVFLVLENRSFDHYFGTFPGADGIPMDPKGRPKVCLPDPEAPGTCHRPYRDRTSSTRAARMARSAAESRSTAGKMDGFVTALREIGNGCLKHPDEKPCPQAADGPRTTRRGGLPHTAKEPPDLLGVRRDVHCARSHDYFDRSWTLPAHRSSSRRGRRLAPTSTIRCRARRTNSSWRHLRGRPREASGRRRWERGPTCKGAVTWLLYKVGGVVGGTMSVEGIMSRRPLRAPRGHRHSSRAEPPPRVHGDSGDRSARQHPAEHGVHPRCRRATCRACPGSCRRRTGRAPTRLHRAGQAYVAR